MSAQEIDNLDAKRVMDELTSQCFTSFTRQGGNVYPESETEQALRAEIARLTAELKETQEQLQRIGGRWSATIDHNDGLQSQLQAAREVLQMAQRYMSAPAVDYDSARAMRRAVEIAIAVVLADAPSAPTLAKEEYREDVDCHSYKAEAEDRLIQEEGGYE